MNKIASIFLLVPLTISLIIISALLEDYCFRGAGCVVGLSLFFVAFAIGSDSKFRDWLGFYFFTMGPILAGMFYILSLFLKVHVYTTGSTVRIMSRFYTRTLAEGTRLERKNIAYAFKTDGFIDGIDRENFYLVSTEKGTCIVCDKYGKQFELLEPVTIVQQDFPNGTLEFLQDAHGAIYDFHGRTFKDKDSYTPIINDYTIYDGPL
jgi:hypothetical protein